LKVKALLIKVAKEVEDTQNGALQYQLFEEAGKKEDSSKVDRNIIVHITCELD
jgi:hypothetical protein